MNDYYRNLFGEKTFKVPIDAGFDCPNRDGLRIAIELKKDANTELVLNYLFKYTDLQINYNFITQTAPKVRDIKQSKAQLDAMDLVGGEDYEKLESARLLSSSEYSL